MTKIYLYLFKLSSYYILINLFLITILVLFINILEISRVVDKDNSDLSTFLILTTLKIPTIISEVIPFVIIISIGFLFRNLISNNELISIRNIGFSILDVFKPIAISIFIFGLFILLIINPISAKFEREFDRLTKNDPSTLYSIKFINKGMWIKNLSNNDTKNFIKISEIDLDRMIAKKIKILHTSLNENKIIIAESGKIKDKSFELSKVSILNIDNDTLLNKDNYNLRLNFDKLNIIDSISNFKFIPFYKYFEHTKNLKKFNLHSSEVSLFYLSEIFKPLFLVVIGFTVMGFSGKFKRNENFFKVLFISMLIGFLIFLLKEITIALTIKLSLSFIFSYFIIFSMPMIVGLYQVIKIEKD